jgi:hypothetical protein
MEATGSAPAAAPAPPEDGPSRHRNLYVIIAVVALVVVIVGLFTYGFHKRDQQTEEKAQQLQALFVREGLPTLSSLEPVERVLGSDGGVVCEDPHSALGKAMLDLELSNGAATVGIRPVIVDRNVVQGEELILSVYCPEQLPGFRSFVEGKKYDAVIR